MASVSMADSMDAASGTKKKQASSSSSSSSSNASQVLKPIPAVAKLLAARLKLLGPNEIKALVTVITADTSQALLKLFPELAPLIKKAAPMNPKDINAANIQGQDGMPGDDGSQQGSQPQPQPGQ